MREPLKRNHRVYKEIEKFEPYELTQCIAFEMAIRNHEVGKIVADSTRDEKKQDEYEECGLFVKYGITDEWIDYIGKVWLLNSAKKDSVESYNALSEQFSKQKTNSTYLMNTEIILEIMEYYKKLNRFENVMETDDCDDKYYTMDGAYLMGFIINDEGNHIPLLPGEPIDEIDIHFFKELDKNILANILRNTIINRHNIKLKRPIVKFSTAPKVDVEINLSLPREELKDYILKIKDNFDNDNLTMNNPLQLLGKDSQKSDTKISTKKLADKFFIYDYVTWRLAEINKFDQEAEDEHNEEVLNIRGNSSLTGKDKQIQIEVLNQQHHENLIKIPITDIFREIELDNGIPQGTVSRYYYQMKPFIVDLKYKELVTGAIN